jgi:ADP-ribose pyrophosphatase YjhB (NUDIX family)
MILKLRRLLGLDNKQEKVENYSELHKSLMGLNERIDEIAEDFTVKNENYKQLLKSKGLSDDIAKSVQVRHINFVESHKKEIHEVLMKRKEIKSKCDKLLSDPEISKAVKEIEFFDNLKNKYKNKEIGLREYDLILKAKTGKTKYSDILVYDKDGKLLLVQRDQHDNNGSKWGVPGGHVDTGEEFLEAAQRELFEETGIWVDELEEIAVYDKEGKEIHYFKVDLKEETQVVVQNKEGQDYKWIEYTELEDIEMPFNMKENLYKVLGFEEKEVKIIKAVSSGQISKELGEGLIEKARSGVYKDTPENRKKGRVGQKYGSNVGEKGKKELFDVETQKMPVGRRGRFIVKTNTNPAQTYKGVKNYLDNKNQDFDVNFSRSTSSIYVKTQDKNGNEYDIRIANHSKAIDSVEEWKPIEFTDFNSKSNSFEISIDTSAGISAKKLKDIFGNIENLQSQISKIDLDLDPEEYYYKNDYSKIKTPLLEKINGDDYGLASNMLDTYIDEYKRADKKFKEFGNKKKLEKEKLEQEENKKKFEFDLYGTKFSFDPQYKTIDFEINHLNKLKEKEYKLPRRAFKRYLERDLGKQYSEGLVSKEEVRNIIKNKIKEIEETGEFKKSEDLLEYLYINGIISEDILLKSFPEEKHYPGETKEEYGAHEVKESPKREKEEKEPGGYEHKQARSKEEFKEKEHLWEMIQEHERLIKVISPFADSSDAVKEELKIQKKELKEYKEKLNKIEDKGLKKVEEDEESIEKSRSGVYSDNAENRRLKRVGKKYGESSNQEEGKQGNDKKEDDKESKPKQSIEEYAKNASQEALENASKGKDEELRVAAKKELKRRETEENESDRPEEGVSGEAEKKTGEESPSSDKKGEKDE